MGSSGSSSMLRFVSDTGENIAVVVGVHNYVRWCDIISDIPDNQTAAFIHPLYYQDVTTQNAQLSKQLAACSATTRNGRRITATYTVATGNNLSANIIIG